MPFSLPTSVTSFLTGDSATTRALSSLKSAVDPLLQLVGSCFEVTTDGTLRVKRPLLLDKLIATRAEVKTLIASLPAQFAGIVNRGSIEQLGDTRLKGTTVIQKKDDGTEGSLLVQNNITAQGNVTNSTGFKAIYDMGFAFVNSATSSTRYRTVLLTQNAANTTTYYQMPTLFQPLYSGSIIGLQSWSMGTAGGLVYCQLYKNTTGITGTPIIDIPLGSAAQNVGDAVTFPKGTYPFIAKDYFPVSVAWTVGGNQCTHIRLFYELSA